MNESIWFALPSRSNINNLFQKMSVSTNLRFYVSYGLFAKRSGQQKKFRQYGAKQQQFLFIKKAIQMIQVISDQ